MLPETRVCFSVLAKRGRLGCKGLGAKASSASRTAIQSPGGLFQASAAGDAGARIDEVGCGFDAIVLCGKIVCKSADLIG